jgi:hypothetical protein
VRPQIGQPEIQGFYSIATSIAQVGPRPSATFTVRIGVDTVKTQFLGRVKLVSIETKFDPSRLSANNVDRLQTIAYEIDRYIQTPGTAEEVFLLQCATPCCRCNCRARLKLPT